MKNQKQVFNAILHIFNRYTRRLKRLIANGLNPKRQKVLEKRLSKLLSKLNSFPRTLKRTASIASLIGVTAITQPNAAIAQNFRPPVFNPFGIPSDFAFGHLEFVDIDNDGDKDLFSTTAYNHTNVYFFENIGSASHPEFDETPLINPSWMQLGDKEPTDFGDIDGDGDFDLFATSNYPNNNNVYFFENVGTPDEPSFGPVQVNPFSFNEDGNSSPRIVDIDSDGDLDYAIPDYYYYNVTINFYENTGNANEPNFNPVPFLSDHFYVSSIQFGDLDKDGDLDVLGRDNAFFGDGLEYKENIGNANVPNFDVEKIYAYNLPWTEYASYLDFVLVDLNNDGNLDLVTSGDSHYDLLFFENEDEESCQQVENLAVIEKTNGYRLTWQALEGSTKCQIKGGKISNSNNTTTYTKFGNEPSSVFLNFSQIKPNSLYFYQVRCNCGVNNDFGPYSYPHFFNTGDHPYPNNARVYNEDMFDQADSFLAADSEIELFPNPVDNNLSIKVELSSASFIGIKIIDITGKLVLTEQKSGLEGINTLNVDLSKLNAGIYCIEVGSEKRLFTKN